MLTLYRFQSSERLSGENSLLSMWPAIHYLFMEVTCIFQRKSVQNEQVHLSERVVVIFLVMILINRKHQKIFGQMWSVGRALLLLLRTCCSFLITCYWHSAPSLPCKPMDYLGLRLGTSSLHMSILRLVSGRATVWLLLGMDTGFIFTGCELLLIQDLFWFFLVTFICVVHQVFW